MIEDDMLALSAACDRLLMALEPGADRPHQLWFEPTAAAPKHYRGRIMGTFPTRWDAERVAARCDMAALAPSYRGKWAVRVRPA